MSLSKSVLLEKHKRKEDILNEIKKLEIEINTLKDFANQCINFNNNEILNEDYTFNLISNNNFVRNLSIRDIVFEYIKNGVKYSNFLIRKHVEQHIKSLLNKSKIKEIKFNRKASRYIKINECE